MFTNKGTHAMTNNNKKIRRKNQNLKWQNHGIFRVTLQNQQQQQNIYE